MMALAMVAAHASRIADATSRSFVATVAADGTFGLVRWDDYNRGGYPGVFHAADEAYKGAYAASHASGTEAIGQSTGMAGILADEQFAKAGSKKAAAEQRRCEGGGRGQGG